MHASLIISLATAAAKLSVGGFFLAPWVGVFFLHPPEGGGALGRGSAYRSLRTPAPGLGSMGNQCKNQPSQTEHMLKMPAGRRHQNKLKWYLRQSINVVII